MIYLAGISISLFISALLLSKKNKSRADFFLLIWILALALHLFLYYINLSSSPYKVPYFLGLEIPFPLIHGPLLYLYVSAVTDQFPRRYWIVLLHFLPVSLGYLYLFPFFLSSYPEKVDFYVNGFEGYRDFMNYGLILIFVSGVFYTVWSLALLRKHKENILNQFSDLEEVSLSWLQFLIYGFSVIWSIVIFTNNDVYIFLGVSLFVILIGFFGVQQKTIFASHRSDLTNPEKQHIGHKKKYQKSGLKDEVADEVYRKLMHLFTVEAYYKRNQLSLRELASELDIHPNYLSQIINQREGVSFYDFVNSFRSQEFKRLVKDQKHQHFTLLALAFECGFNSKSSFNRSIKRHTGQTPSEFVRSMAN